MGRETLQCVSCILLAVLAVLLTEVCCEEQGKSCDFRRSVFFHCISSNL